MAVAEQPPSPLAGEGDSALRAERGEGLPRLRQLARTMRKDMTAAEHVLWTIVRDRRFSGWKFRRQVPIGCYIADFVCFERRLIVEADGSQHIDNAHDVARTAWLAAQGFNVLRFWNREILTQRRDVADRLYAALAGPLTPLAASRESPSPARGEGEGKDHAL